MTLSGTPGPGGFGPSPHFGPPHPGIHLTPARVSPRPGIYSGPSTAAAGGHPWLWVAFAVVVLLAVVGSIVLYRARSAASARR